MVIPRDRRTRYLAAVAGNEKRRRRARRERDLDRSEEENSRSHREVAFKNRSERVAEPFKRAKKRRMRKSGDLFILLGNYADWSLLLKATAALHLFFNRGAKIELDALLILRRGEGQGRRVGGFVLLSLIHI